MWCCDVMLRCVPCNSWRMSLRERELAWTTTIWCGCSIQISLCERQHSECNCHGRWEVLRSRWPPDPKISEQTSTNETANRISTDFNWFQLFPRNGLVQLTLSNCLPERSIAIPTAPAWGGPCQRGLGLPGRNKNPGHDLTCLSKMLDDVRWCWMVLDDVGW